MKISKSYFKELFSKSSEVAVAVFGDVMIDKYIWGNVTRISPEAPVPVINYTNETNHLGGAANVASNLCSLGFSTYLFGILGNDENGILFNNLSKNLCINTDFCYIDNSRPTTTKTRIMGNNRHIARLDRESCDYINVRGENFLLNNLYNFPNLNAIVIEDYNKGILTPNCIKNIIAFAHRENIPVFVDPKFNNFFEYKDVTLFKPNRFEAAKALDIELKNDDGLKQCGKLLIEKLNAENVLLTLGADGMMLFEKNGNITKVPTVARTVSDVSGAGDTAIATLTASMACGADICTAARIANVASGIVCSQPGTVSITQKDIIDFLE